MGYITKGKGITVHVKNCPNIINEKKRLIDVFWKEDLKDGTYPVDLKIECYDRANLVTDVMQIFSSQKVSVTSLNCQLHSSTMTTSIACTIYVRNASQLRDVMNVLLNVKSVYEVTRVFH